jgi:BirA family biotin operon repressor/biotin-[acetyl-CoA-carboxylase] ligase
VNVGAAPEAFPEAGAVDVEDEALLSAFLVAFTRAYRPRDPAFGPDVLANYRQRCATLGLRVRARTTDGELVEGEATDLDDDGGLVVRTAAGVELVRFGAVEHLE